MAAYNLFDQLNLAEEHSEIEAELQSNKRELHALTKKSKKKKGKKRNKLRRQVKKLKQQRQKLKRHLRDLDEQLAKAPWWAGTLEKSLPELIRTGGAVLQTYIECKHGKYTK